MTTEVSPLGDASPAAAADDGAATPLPEDRFLDRELSWLALQRARARAGRGRPTRRCSSAPKFLAIFASNLDEFFMVRVAGLKRRIATGHRRARGERARCRARCSRDLRAQRRELMHRQATLFHDEILPALGPRTSTSLRWEEPRAAERDQLSTSSGRKVFPVLTPLAVDPAHPFPYISGLSLNLAVVVRDPRAAPSSSPVSRCRRSSSGFVAGPEPPRFVPLEDVIAAHLGELFPGHGGAASTTPSASPATRTSRWRRTTPRTSSSAIEHELSAAGSARRCGSRWRESIAAHVLDLLVRELDIGTDEVVPRCPACSTSPACMGHRPASTATDLKLPRVPARRRTSSPTVETRPRRDVFEAMRDQRRPAPPPVRLVLHERAALHRAGRDRPARCSRSSRPSTAPAATRRSSTPSSTRPRTASRSSRSSRSRRASTSRPTSDWARKLEQAGVHVVYGLVGLKTHCKLSLVVRDDGDRLRRYTHIGTGNYHPKTARLYEDVGLLTTDEEVGDDVARLFNVLSGYSMETEYRRLLVAPALGADRARRPHRARDREPPGRAAAAHPHQVQLDRRRGHHRLALPRVAGGRARRHLGARHLRAAPRRTRPVREHPRAQRARPVPGALAGVFEFDERRRAGGLDRVRRPHAPQPRPAGRDARAGSGPPSTPASWEGPHRPRLRPRHRRMGPRSRRRVAEGRTARRTARRSSTSSRRSSRASRAGRRRRPDRGDDHLDRGPRPRARPPAGGAGRP